MQEIGAITLDKKRVDAKRFVVFCMGSVCTHVLHSSLTLCL